jgi:rhodanese-related sulfurtransferase
MKTIKQLMVAGFLAVFGLVSCSTSNGQQVENVNVKSFNEQMQQEKEGTFQLIDVRTAGEFSSGHIQNATNIDFYAQDFKDQIAKLDKKKTVYVYCRSGGRSGNAAQMMKQMGFEKVVNMQGGMMSWNASGLPVSK